MADELESVTSVGRELAGTVLAAFTSHRLVGIGEWHGLQNHHDALQLLLTDPRLPEVVDDIVVEFGNARYQDTIDRFIAGQPVADADLRAVWRNTTQSPRQTWDAPVYEQFYRTVRAVNRARPGGRQIRVLLGDPPIDWSAITDGSGIVAFLAQRSAHAAAVVQQQILAKGHRALVCYGAGHLVHPESGLGEPPTLASIIQQRTGERMFTITALVPSSAGISGLADAGLYLGQPEGLTASQPNPAIYLDPAYWAELQRRNTLLDNPVNLDSYRREQPVQYWLP